MSTYNILDIPVQFISVIRMSTLLDNLPCPLQWMLAPEIRYTLLRNDYLDGVLAMVQVTAKWNDRADLATLCSAWAGEN